MDVVYIINFWTMHIKTHCILPSYPLPLFAYAPFTDLAGFGILVGYGVPAQVTNSFIILYIKDFIQLF